MLAAHRAALALTLFAFTSAAWGWQPAQTPDPDLTAADEAFQEGSYEEAEERYRSIIDRRPEDHAVQFRYGYCLHNNKKYAEAVEMFHKASDDAQYRAPALYNIACGQALLGKKDESCQALDEALSAGFNDVRLLRNDGDLALIRDDDRYKQAVERLESSFRGPLTWDRVSQRLNREARNGFSGAVLLVRDGKVVLEEAYGMADPAAEIRNTPQTIFAIGSTPIDFTKAAILLLAEEGKLSLDDPISKYFHDMPEDKQAITIKHLMTGRSGLKNFHDLPTDEDPDHAWIDRDEAVRRILAQELLFEPGKGEAHSHSAWGLLAAIVEIASGETYPEFTRKRLFEPAGMKDTGFFGEPYDKERMAVGTGAKSAGEVNAPPYWGKTSWLVMGSGGQVSTLADLNRWQEALRAGKILSKESLPKYFGPGEEVLAGGNMYGFEVVYSTGPQSRFFIITNDNGPRRAAANRRLSQELATLVRGGGGPPAPSGYSLGVMLDVNDDGRASIVELVEGGAAQKAGLEVGDVLLAIDGDSLVGEALTGLRSHMSKGEKVRLKIERDGEEKEIEVQPMRSP